MSTYVKMILHPKAFHDDTETSDIEVKSGLNEQHLLEYRHITLRCSRLRDCLFKPNNTSDT